MYIFLKIIMHNFPPYFSYVATLSAENTLATEQSRCFPLVAWPWKDHVWCDRAINWRLTNSSIPRNINTDWHVCSAPFWLNMESSLANNIIYFRSTVHAVHGLPLPECLSTEPVTMKTSLVPTLTWKSFQQLFAVYPLSRYKFLIKIRSSWHVYKEQW